MGPSSQLNVTLKKYWKLTLLNVHPDYFSRFPSIKQHNESSIKLISQLLFPQDQFASESSTLFPTISLHHFQQPLTLYSKKVLPSNTPGSTFSRDVELNGIPFRKVEFDVSDLSNNEVCGSKLLESRIYKRFVDLLGQLEISLDEEDHTLVNQLLQPTEVPKPCLKLRPRPSSTLPGLYRRSFLHLQQTQQPLEPFPNPSSFKSPPHPTSATDSLADVFFRQHRLIMFDDCLSPHQKEIGKAHLWLHLPRLRFSSWHTLPLLLSTSFSRHIAGFLIVPFQFDIKEFSMYLETNRKLIENEFLNLQQV